MKPHFQGQLDGFCGIYSSINATRLIQNIGPDESAALFNRILSTIERRKNLSSILKHGLTNRDIACSFKEVIEKEYPVKRSKPFHKATGLAVYWREINDFLKGDQKRAVVLAIEGWNWAHWTVIKKATNKSFSLFDSGHLKRVNRNRSTTKKISRARPILLYPTMTYFLSRKSRI